MDSYSSSSMMLIIIFASITLASPIIALAIAFFTVGIHNFFMSLGGWWGVSIYAALLLLMPLAVFVLVNYSKLAAIIFGSVCLVGIITLNVLFFYFGRCRSKVLFCKITDKADLTEQLAKDMTSFAESKAIVVYTSKTVWDDAIGALSQDVQTSLKAKILPDNADFTKLLTEKGASGDSNAYEISDADKFYSGMMGSCACRKILKVAEGKIALVFLKDVAKISANIKKPGEHKLGKADETSSATTTPATTSTAGATNQQTGANPPIQKTAAGEASKSEVEPSKPKGGASTSEVEPSKPKGGASKSTSEASDKGQASKSTGEASESTGEASKSTVQAPEPAGEASEFTGEASESTDQPPK